MTTNFEQWYIKQLADDYDLYIDEVERLLEKSRKNGVDIYTMLEDYNNSLQRIHDIWFEE